MAKRINAKSVIGNFLVSQNKGYISKRELEKYYSVVDELLPDGYYTYDDITFEEFCDEYSFLVQRFKDIAIPITDKNILIRYFRLGLPKSVVNVFDQAERVLISKFDSSVGLSAHLEEYLEYLTYLNDNNPQQARKLAEESLLRTGIIDENGNLKPPYNGEKVNNDDFTRGPRLIKK